MTAVKTFIVDSFTDVPIKGNPAGVCVSGKEVAPELMQRLAGILGFSEFAYAEETKCFIRYERRFVQPILAAADNEEV